MDPLGRQVLRDRDQSEQEANVDERQTRVPEARSRHAQDRKVAHSSRSSNMFIKVRKLAQLSGLNFRLRLDNVAAGLGWTITNSRIIKKVKKQNGLIKVERFTSDLTSSF